MVTNIFYIILYLYSTSTSTASETNTPQSSDSTESPERDFNNFEFWRTPIINVDIPDDLKTEPTNNEHTSKDSSESSNNSGKHSMIV